jgi:hypothetical protein
MAKAINLVNDARFESDADTDEKKTTWILRTLTGVEFIRATANGYVDHEMILNAGIVGWENFVNEDGTDIEFSIKNVGRIPPTILQDISFEIQAMSGLAEKERKNS